jgi:membrane protein implicated in regulation of membrane protease activity
VASTPNLAVVDWVTIAFLVGGLLLIASEVAYTSLVQVFLGAAALMVGGLRALGIIDSVTASFLAWAFLSLGMALPLRPVVKRLFKTSTAVFDPSHEDQDAVGAIVEVIEPVDEDTQNGRIKLHGTTWAAQSIGGVLPKGTKAKLVGKKKLVWFVEPLSVLDEPVPKEENVLQVEEQKVKG